MKKNNKKGMSIILAIILTIIMSLIALYMIDYIIPFSRNVKGIENVSKAYYQAEKGVEEALFYIKDKNNFGTNSGKLFDSNKVIDDKIDILANGNLLPSIGFGNSDFDFDYNKLKVGEPIQLEIGKGFLLGSDYDKQLDEIKFFLRVPDLNGDSIYDETLSGSDNSVVNWQIIGSKGLLNSSGTQITYNEINNIFKDGECVLGNGCKFNIGNDLNNEEVNFFTFYQNNCRGTNSGCILKMSVINKLELINNNGGDSTPLPYLEWKLDLTQYLNGQNPIPLRYTQIHTEGKSYGFKKEIDVRVPQQAVNEAFDFTVFQ